MYSLTKAYINKDKYHELQAKNRHSHRRHYLQASVKMLSVESFDGQRIGLIRALPTSLCFRDTESLA